MHGVTSQKNFRHYRSKKLTIPYVLSRGFQPKLLYKFDISAMHAT